MAIVKIGNKELNISSSAATAIFYKRVFHEDLLRAFSNITPGDDGSVSYDSIETIQKLAYIMGAEANGGLDGLKNASYDGYIEWCATFNPFDFINEEAITGVIREFEKDLLTVTKKKVTSKKNTKKKEN